MEIQKIKLEPVKNVAATHSGKLRVAAYCRVSTDMEDQRTSFEGQVRHYTELIQANPEWELAGIFADEGITGTSAEKRPEFQRLMKECEAGNVDLVLTKSISRFARNTLECLTYVRHMNNLGVHIVFESNNIDTRTAFSEMLLTVLAAFAHPSFDRVDFWWVDELIDHIEFGAHSRTEREYMRLAALGQQVTDDRTLKVFWKCGLITTVMSGVDADREHPPMIAELYNKYLKRQKEKKVESA